jgi:hypothetical protein
LFLKFLFYFLFQLNHGNPHLSQGRRFDVAHAGRGFTRSLQSRSAIAESSFSGKELKTR